jgi:uncharacterized phiE125 gp8 family phage protein
MTTPISLTEARQHLKLEEDDDQHDDEIALWIEAAAAHIEDMCGLVCAEREEETFILDGFPRVITLPRRPIDPESIVISYLDGDVEGQLFTDFRSYVQHGWLRIVPAASAVWPATIDGAGTVTVTAKVGYPVPEGDASSICPPQIKVATKMMLGHWFANREAAADKVMVEVPGGVAALLEPFRMRRV